MSRRKKYGSDLKTKVALEALKGERTLNEIAGMYEVHPNQIRLWRKKLIEFSFDAFSSRKERDSSEAIQKQEELYQQIGQLTMEVEYLKKKLKIFH